MPTWNELRAAPRDNRPRRWVAETTNGWPYPADVDEATDAELALWLYRQGWPVRPAPPEPPTQLGLGDAFARRRVNAVT